MRFRNDVSLYYIEKRRASLRAFVCCAFRCSENARSLSRISSHKRRCRRRKGRIPDQSLRRGMKLIKLSSRHVFRHLTKSYACGAVMCISSGDRYDGLAIIESTFKRGPGRPPKHDEVMSGRQRQRLYAKARRRDTAGAVQALKLTLRTHAERTVFRNVYKGTLAGQRLRQGLVQMLKLARDIQQTGGPAFLGRAGAGYDWQLCRADAPL
jgi:hypothetical protein